MPSAYAILFAANLLYGTSYSVTRLVLADVGPATLALARLFLGSLLLVPLALARRDGRRLSRGDRWSLMWMGLFGFAGAFALGNWGLARSTATNAALLITVEPASLVLFSPLLLGERLTRREALGAGLTLAGATVVVVNGIPGLTLSVVPHWRGDLLLVLSGLAYASYSFFGRSVLGRHPAVPVTAWSILWGMAAMTPLAAAEWASGQTPSWTPTAVAGTLYLAVVITAIGYALWNYALERVEAPRAAIFITVQPLVGALLGVGWLGEPLTAFTVAGGGLILAGLHLAVKSGRVG
ncbi:MAG TPA: EamA family transporter [Methylomirabilota bacterium]|jgi:drug/metabolite transporter (DMT)-like permease|nr:EamA family transporter [Methylomirabilota bacterium]